MNSYQYIVKDRGGHAVTGIVDAASEGEAAEILHRKELIVISLKPAKKVPALLREKAGVLNLTIS